MLHIPVVIHTNECIFIWTTFNHGIHLPNALYYVYVYIWITYTHTHICVIRKFNIIHSWPDPILSLTLFETTGWNSKSYSII